MSHIHSSKSCVLPVADVFPQGCRAFRGISPNVEAEESGMRDDSGMQDVQYTEVRGWEEGVGEGVVWEGGVEAESAEARPLELSVPCLLFA